MYLSTSKAHEIFLEKQKHLRPGKQIIELKRLIETQWACRHQSVVALRYTFGPILSTMVKDDTEKSILAHGYLQRIEDFQFVVCLVILEYIFGITKNLSVVRT